jgi:hypothetical protein
MQANQEWTLASKESGIKSSSGNCLSGQQTTAAQVQVHEYGGLAFLSNTAADEVLQATYLDKSFTLAPASVSLIDTAAKTVLMSTGEAKDPVDQEPKVVGSSVSKSWEAFQETVGYGAKNRSSAKVLDQVQLTENDFDYLWYKIEAPPKTKVSDVTVTAAEGTVTYPYVDGKKLAILSAAMGLRDGGDGPSVGKGVTSVKVKGSVVSGVWTHSWVLEGEEKQIFSEDGAGSVPWRQFGTSYETTPITWLKAIFDLPVSAVDDKLSFALDLSSMWKGVAYVNGFHIGRYWLIDGKCNGQCAPPIKNGHCYMHWKDCNKPTQTIYHIPTKILKSKSNQVVLFEEGSPPKGKQREPEAVQLLALASKAQEEFFV